MSLLIRLVACAAIAANVGFLVGMISAFGASAVGAIFAVAWLSASIAVCARPNVRVVIAAVVVSTLLPVVALAIGAAGSAARWWAPQQIRPDAFFLAAVTPEREIAITGAALLWAAGEVREGKALIPHLRKRYDELTEEHLFAPSPLSTAAVGATDGLRFGPREATVAAVFLHGKGGNFALNCWLFARAIGDDQIATICPTLDFEGNWARDGESIVRVAIDAARSGGAQYVILAGLSNGAIGASVLAERLPVDGLVLVSGLSRYARPTRVPTLVVTGDADPVAPPARIAAYRGANVETHVIGTGHWQFLTQYDAFREKIAEWAAKHTP